MQRIAIRTLLLTCSFIVGCTVALAQESWPQKRITFTVAYSAGGFADTVARLIATRLQQRLGQSIVVQNVDGAAGSTAARQVAFAPADGYTFLVTTTGVAINDALYSDRAPVSSKLIPISIPISAPEALTSNPKSGIRTFEDMLAVARSGKAFVGTPGIGSGSHISAQYFFKNIAKAQVKFIPFPGGTQSMQALMVGDINIRAAAVTTLTIPAIRNGELVGLAVASEQRDPSLPDVPTYKELGFDGFLATNWVGIFAAAGTASSVSEKLNTEIEAVMKDPEMRERMDALSLQITSRNLSSTVDFFKADVARWGTMVAATEADK